MEIDRHTGNLEVKAFALSNVRMVAGNKTASGQSDLEIHHSLGTKDIDVRVYELTMSGSPAVETARVPVLVDYSFGGLSSHASDLTNYITLHFAVSKTATFRVIVTATTETSDSF